MIEIEEDHYRITGILGHCRGQFMENPWEIHGKFMGNLWEIYVKSMETILPFSETHGKFMGIHRKFMETIHGTSWKGSCKLHVKFMGNPWKLHGEFIEIHGNGFRGS